MNLKTLLSVQAERYGDKIAIVSGDCRLSYTELDKASNKAAHALLKMGVGKGDRVAILALNSSEFVVMYFGIVKIGNEEWRARAEEDIDEGEEITVAGISGVTLDVEKTVEKTAEITEGGE